MLCAAQTQVPRASLVVTRSDGAQACPDAATLAEQVRGVAGANVIGAGLGGASTGPVETWVQVAMAHDFGGYRAQISTFGLHHGTRTLEDLGPGCSSLADAVAVTIAIFLDPYANVPTPPAAVAPTPPIAAPAPHKEPVWRPEPFLDASGGVAVGVYEHSEPLLGASAGLHLTERWSLALGGSYLFSDTVRAKGGQVELKLSYGYLLGCARAFGAPEGARLDWCAAPLLGSLGGSGHDYTSHNYSKRILWAAVAAGPQLVFPFGGLVSGVLTGQAVLPLTRTGFSESLPAGATTVFTPAAVAGLVSFGIRGAL